MPIYEAWLPVWASVHYRLETDEEITDPAKLRELMLNEGEPVTDGLCRFCACGMEIDPSNHDVRGTDELEITRVDTADD